MSTRFLIDDIVTNISRRDGFCSDLSTLIMRIICQVQELPLQSHRFILDSCNTPWFARIMLHFLPYADIWISLLSSYTNGQLSKKSFLTRSITQNHLTMCLHPTHFAEKQSLHDPFYMAFELVFVVAAERSFQSKSPIL